MFLVAVPFVTGALASSPSPVRAAPAESSCFVSIVELLEPPLTVFPDGGVSVRIYNGASRLFETPIKPLSRPVFTNRITFFTAKSMPVRLVVVIWAADGQTADPERQDEGFEARRTSWTDSQLNEDVLGIGFEGLIGDYGTDESSAVPEKQSSKSPEKPSVNREKRRPGGGAILCDTTIDWPPADGKHMVKCGSSTLLVRTEMIVRRKK